ncbi:type VII secretion target [Actinokineospora bangkokensis]|uniref:ESX-1 secretion-associated protein n=1 Tax=Actinokineospora bangkokensis TaxID=1193682 RepID=A0A1Q9LJJ9_9PSEU|nr:type VII secretion target [Actinokineospora bangkokensis]OLR92222.1 hypothetical protein BJP25_23155 [Actinokineospora bangkokensis]
MTHFDVDTTQLRGHATSLDEVADRLSAIGGGLPSGLSDLALGLFANFLAVGLQGAMTQTANTVTAASSSVAEVSTGIARTAAGYQGTDGGNATTLDREYR